jgi:uncharacterized protein (DUF433 family)
MSEPRNAIYSEPDKDGGSLVFLGTRVPLRTLLDYVETGRTLEEFLGNFPAVSRERAIAFLEEAARRK